MKRWINTGLLALLVATQIPTMVKDHRANECMNYWLANPAGGWPEYKSKGPGLKAAAFERCFS